MQVCHWVLYQDPGNASINVIHRGFSWDEMPQRLLLSVLSLVGHISLIVSNTTWAVRVEQQKNPRSKQSRFICLREIELSIMSPARRQTQEVDPHLQ